MPPASVNKLSEEIVIEEKEISEADPPIMFPGENDLSFKVSDRLINPNPLIVAAENGLKRTPWSKKDMHSTKRDQLPIRCISLKL